MPLRALSPPVKFALNAIRVPSGDQAGQKSWASPSDSLRNPPPFALIRHTEEHVSEYLIEQSLANATVRPSGAQVTSIAETIRGATSRRACPCAAVIQIEEWKAPLSGSTVPIRSKAIALPVAPELA